MASGTGRNAPECRGVAGATPLPNPQEGGYTMTPSDTLMELLLQVYDEMDGSERFEITAIINE